MYQCAFRLVAFVEEGKAKGKADAVEDERILRPAYHCAGAHDGGNVAIDEAPAGKIGDLDHVFDGFLSIRMIIFARFGEDDLRLSRGGEIVQRNNQIPAVHLPLVDLLRTMIEAGRITQANRVRCCEHAEPAIWTDDAVLIEERHLPV